MSIGASTRIGRDRGPDYETGSWLGLYKQELGSARLVRAEQGCPCRTGRSAERLSGPQLAGRRGQPENGSSRRHDVIVLAPHAPFDGHSTKPLTPPQRLP